MPFMEQLPKLPDAASLVITYHGTTQKAEGSPVNHVVYLGIARPIMQETEDGELVAMYIMSARRAVNVARSILKQASYVVAHMEGVEDCDHEQDGDDEHDSEQEPPDK